MTVFRTLCCAVFGLYAGAAAAVPFTETTDAGRDMASAIVLPDGTTSINGQIVNTAISDVDLYKFSLSAMTTLTIRMLFPGEDANLILFNGLGQGLAGDDDDGSSCADSAGLGSLDSCLTLSLAAGDYFLGAGDNNMGAFENAADAAAGTNDFIDNDFGILSVPTTETLGLIGAESGDTDLNDEGPYTIEFSEAVSGPVAAVPLPATLPLLVGGLAGLAWATRRHA